MIKKRIFIAVFACIMILGVLGLSSCGDDGYTDHDHVFGEWSNNTATCTAGGIQTRECSKCGYTERETTPALGHDLEEHGAVAPTCAMPGNEAYSACKRCRYTTYKEIAALHDLGDFFAEIPATCDSNGLVGHYFCAICDKYYGADKKELSSIEIMSPGHEVSDTGCPGCSSSGLEYKLIKNGKEYSVIGRGECTDASIVIPSTYNGKPVTMISPRAFQNYRNLVSITIPESITRIDSSAFEGCYNLVEVINRSALEFKKGEKSFGMIAYYAYDIHSLESRVVRYGNYTFYTTTDGDSYLVNYLGILDELKLPKDFMGEEYGVGSYAFYDNKTLRSVEISDGIVSLGKYAFAGSSNLYVVKIGNTLEKIDTGAFNKCDYIKEVHLNDLGLWCEIDFAEGEENSFPNANKLYVCGEEVVELVIPNGVTEINAYAFCGYKGIERVVIPNSVKSIGDYAFAHGAAIKEISLGDGVVNIGKSAFLGCEGVSEITIPKSVKIIGEDAFYLSTGIERVNIEDISAWCKIDFQNYASNPVRYSEALYLSGELVKELVIGDSVTEIGDYAFYYCRSITSVEISASVKKIGYQAFCECDGISEVTIPEGVTEISGYAFYSASRLAKVEFASGSQLKAIGKSAFAYCAALVEIILPDGVEVVEEAAFVGCSTLSKAALPSGLIVVAPSLFRGCASLSEITLGDVTAIGTYAFYGCQSLIRIEISASVKSIGDHAFGDCSTLSDVYYGSTNADWIELIKETVGNEAIENAELHFE